MKLLLLSFLVTAATADNYCKGIFFNDNYYNVEILKEGIMNIHQIVYSDDNTVYFTFDQLATVPTRALAYIKLDTRQTGLIHGVRNATGLTIDHKSNRVYVGGSDGLFFLNQNKVPEKLPVNDDIRYLFFKDVLYFINNRHQAFKFDYGAVELVIELAGVAVDKLIADDDNNIFFLQNTNLSRVKVGTRIINTHETYKVNAIATDYNFKPYISTTRGVYVYNKYKYALDKVSDIIDLRELTFNRKGEAIYAVVDHIVKLNYNPLPCLGD